NQLVRIETRVEEVSLVVKGTHVTVLDMHAELQKLGSAHLGNADEVRRLMHEVIQKIEQVGMKHGEVKPQHSFSIRTEGERAAVKQLLARFRQIPAQQQQQVPALQNGIGKLQFGSGDFDEARATFNAVSNNTSDSSAKAEAHFNAYRAALESKNLVEALVAIQVAASLDPKRFEPFPISRYKPKSLLGAGGFGAAFLCHDQFLNSEVVVKTLHDTEIESNMAKVFNEAQILKGMHHPAIISVQDCGYADLTEMARPYIVMEYFSGPSLEKFIQDSGTITPEEMTLIALQVAEGMHAAHQKNILHRDLKPDNILVRKEGADWKVKIIDFGLAMRKATIETSIAARGEGETIIGNSVAGTIKYSPPEQMGEMKGVRPGAYSDVYSFGKVFCYALFKTTDPKDRHWKEVAENIRGNLREMVDQCKEEELEYRYADFEPVLKMLKGLGSNKPIQVQQVEVKVDSPRIPKVEIQPQGEAVQKAGEIITNDLGMKFAWIPAGTFVMGSGTFVMGSPPESEEGRSSNETSHKVRITKGFYMGIYTVTQEQWESVMEINPSSSNKGAKMPVTDVSWDDCQYFIKKLNAKTDGGYRFPTEAEWEYACRAGTTTAYSFGDNLKIRDSNIYGNSIKAVGSYKPNAFGLYDMHGNVWEWCENWFAPYPKGAVTDPKGPAKGKYRVLRGGAFNGDALGANSSVRNLAWPTTRVFIYGFRLAGTANIKAPMPAVVMPATGDTLVAPFTEAKAKEIQKSVAKILKKEVEEKVDLGKGIKLDLVLIPAGKFMMGSPASEYGRIVNETQHEVTLTKPFYMGKYEVTQEQWEGVMGNNPSSRAKGPKVPVTDVSWNDCQDFIKKLNEKTKGGYRLPTEAEWEYACRAGTTTAYSFGDSLTKSDANTAGTSTIISILTFFNHWSKAVGSYKPNAFGLYDMHGNVWEWCENWYGDYLVGEVVGEVTDPTGPATGDYRVLRGGSFNAYGSTARSSVRDYGTPSIRVSSLGFRLARTP
ncbi:MAG: SUMF1/EgtB/PvdO family nonheme iron enzyme, partial [Planctomycetota bacterium]